MAISKQEKDILRMQQMINMLQKDLVMWLSRQPHSQQEMLHRLVDDYERTVEHAFEEARQIIQEMFPGKTPSEKHSAMSQLPKMMKLGLLITVRDAMETELHEEGGYDEESQRET